MGSADIDRVMELAADAPQFDTRDDEPDTEHFWPRDRLAAWTASDDPLLVAEEGGEVAGFLLARVHQPTRKAEIENILVAPEHRGAGIGRELLAEAIERFQDRDVRYVAALTQEGNTDAIGFFTENGFTAGKRFVWLERFLD